MNKTSKRFFVLAALLLFAGSPANGETSETDLSPDPKLSPQQVVAFQLSALQHNDRPSSDAGIERAFRFASPANRLSVGPLTRFSEIVRSPDYCALINALDEAVTDVRVDGNNARVLARVVSASGLEIFYLFVLSKQSDGENVDCWMTDGVMRLNQQDRKGAPRVAL